MMVLSGEKLRFVDVSSSTLAEHCKCLFDKWTFFLNVCVAAKCYDESFHNWKKKFATSFQSYINVLLRNAKPDITTGNVYYIATV